MIGVRIVLGADGAFPELRGAERLLLDAVGTLKGGMASGRTSVVLNLVDNSGRRFFAEISLAHWMAISAAFNPTFMKDEAGV